MGSNRARNFRRRVDDDDDKAEESASGRPPSASVSTKAAPKKKLLSFADDEDENDGNSQSKTLSKQKLGRDREKSSSSSRLLSNRNSSHKLTSADDRRSSVLPSSSGPPLPLSNVQPQAGTYTKEALLELQKNTRSLPFSRPSSNVAAEPKIILKGLIKPQQTQNNTARSISGSGLDEEEMKGEEEKESLPDQAAIEAIRAKRERMRQARVGLAPDYISLDGSTANHAVVEGLSDEEAEFQGGFLGQRSKNDCKKGVFEDFNEKVKIKDSVYAADVYDEEDEEEKLWEEEQFKKALGKRIDDGANRIASANGVPLYSSFHGPMSSPSVAPSFGTADSASGLEMISLSQQAELSKKALHENAQKLKESHGKTLLSLTKTDENLTTSLLSISALENSLSVAGQKYIFMQKLRDFVSAICDFMQEKGSLIEEIEAQMKELSEKRASAIFARRASDNIDEMGEVEAAVKAAMAVFSAHGSSNSDISAATAAALAASAAIRDLSNQPVKLDEFGRDANLQKRKEMERRAVARQKRKARFEAKRVSTMEIDGSYQKIEGESRTDESDSESAAYMETRESLLKCAEKVFSDASDEYSQLSRVKENFERWKRDYLSTYRDAYMALSVPAIFSPYVRLELLNWDPLHEHADFFDMKWHLLLFDYGRPEDGEDFAPDDADANLVPELVEKVAIPILLHQIELCWDMFSTGETRNAVAATSLVTNYVPASSEALAKLFVAVHTRLDKAVASIMVPTWSPLVLKAVPNAAQVSAYKFGMSIRLMRNICLWKDILALPVLENLALNGLLFGKILPHVRSIASNVHDAVTRTERLVDSFSHLRAGPSVTRGHSRKLQPLVDYLLSLGRTLEKRRGSGISDTEISGLARRLKKMLVELNEHDRARELVRTFQLKEAV